MKKETPHCKAASLIILFGCRNVAFLAAIEVLKELQQTNCTGRSEYWKEICEILKSDK